MWHDLAQKTEERASELTLKLDSISAKYRQLAASKPIIDEDDTTEIRNALAESRCEVERMKEELEEKQVQLDKAKAEALKVLCLNSDF